MAADARTWSQMVKDLMKASPAARLTAAAALGRVLPSAPGSRPEFLDRLRRGTYLMPNWFFENVGVTRYICGLLAGGGGSELVHCFATMGRKIPIGPPAAHEEPPAIAIFQYHDRVAPASSTSSSLPAVAWLESQRRRGDLEATFCASCCDGHSRSAATSFSFGGENRRCHNMQHKTRAYKVAMKATARSCSKNCVVTPAWVNSFCGTCCTGATPKVSVSSFQFGGSARNCKTTPLKLATHATEEKCKNYCTRQRMANLYRKP